MHSMSDLSSAKAGSRRRPALAGGIAAAVLGVAAMAVLPAGQALASSQAGSANVRLAADNPSSGDSTTANVAVSPAILLSNLTPSFTLTGVPGDKPVDIAAVTMNVLTNNSTGYNVTVQAEAANLVGTGSNADTIPVTDLSVEETTGGAYLALSATAPVLVHNQTTRSVGAPGDLLSNDYKFNTGIPDVHSDTYSVTLDYVASTNP